MKLLILFLTTVLCTAFSFPQNNGKAVLVSKEHIESTLQLEFHVDNKGRSDYHIVGKSGQYKMTFYCLVHKNTFTIDNDILYLSLSKKDTVDIVCNGRKHTVKFNF